MFFASTNATTKALVADYPAPLVTAVRYSVNLLLIVILFAPRHRGALMRTRRTGLVLLRGGSLAAASLCLALALRRIPMAEATSIIFLAPLIVVLLAGPLLGERVGWIGWAAALGGFLGVLLIVRPGGGLDPVGVVLVLGTVAATVCYQLLSRVLVPTEGTVPMLLVSMLVGTVAFTAMLPWSWGGPAPTTLHILLFLTLGASSALGHYLFTASFRLAPASLIAPVTYLELVWATLLGWLAFGQAPEGLSLVGMGMVAAAGLTVALSSRRRR